LQDGGETEASYGADYGSVEVATGETKADKADVNHRELRSELKTMAV